MSGNLFTSAIIQDEAEPMVGDIPTWHKANA